MGVSTSERLALLDDTRRMLMRFADRFGRENMQGLVRRTGASKVSETSDRDLADLNRYLRDILSTDNVTTLKPITDERIEDCVAVFMGVWTSGNTASTAMRAAIDWLRIIKD